MVPSLKKRGGGLPRVFRRPVCGLSELRRVLQFHYVAAIYPSISRLNYSLPQKKKKILLCPWRLVAATSRLMMVAASNTSGIKPPLRAGISRAHYVRPPASLQDSISAVLTCFAARDAFSGRRRLLLGKRMNYSSGDRAQQHFYTSCAVLWM